MEPTALQSDELLRMAGTARFVWNWALDRCQTFYKQKNKGIPQSQLSSELTALKGQQPWLYDFDSQSLQQVLKNLKQAYENHFNPKMRSGFIKFKTQKNPKQSFRIPQRVVLNDESVLRTETWLGQNSAVSGDRRSNQERRIQAHGNRQMVCHSNH